MSAVKVSVTVEYVGVDAFHDVVPSAMSLEAIKRKAMHEFELEQSSADRYVLEYNGSVLTSEHVKLETFETDAVTLQLRLKEETEKG